MNEFRPGLAVDLGYLRARIDNHQSPEHYFGTVQRLLPSKATKTIALFAGVIEPEDRQYGLLNEESPRTNAFYRGELAGADVILERYGNKHLIECITEPIALPVSGLEEDQAHAKFLLASYLEDLGEKGLAVINDCDREFVCSVGEMVANDPAHGRCFGLGLGTILKISQDRLVARDNAAMQELLRRMSDPTLDFEAEFFGPTP
jgi:hypothetical protein